MTRVLLFFIDGLGIGTRGSHNPLDGLEASAPLAHFQSEQSEIPFDGVLVETDPRLGVEGRPQSASGQTTILTASMRRQPSVITSRAFRTARCSTLSTNTQSSCN
jgi:hypothetical protein